MLWNKKLFFGMNLQWIELTPDCALDLLYGIYYQHFFVQISGNIFLKWNYNLKFSIQNCSPFPFHFSLLTFYILHYTFFILQQQLSWVIPIFRNCIEGWRCQKDFCPRIARINTNNYGYRHYHCSNAMSLIVAQLAKLRK